MVPTVTLTSSTPESFNFWLDEWMVPTNQLLQILSGAESHPLTVDGWFKKHLTREQRRAEVIKVWARGIGEHDYKSDISKIKARADRIDRNPGGLTDVLKQARRLMISHPVFLESLVDVIVRPDQSIAGAYLQLTAGLEAYDSQLRGIGPIPLATFKARSLALRDAAKHAGMSSADRKFLKRWLSGHSFFSLEQRLTTLAKDVSALNSWRLAASEMASLRNDLAHGNAGVDPRRLRTAYEQAFDLSQNIVLKELHMV